MTKYLTEFLLSLSYGLLALGSISALAFAVKVTAATASLSTLVGLLIAATFLGSVIRLLTK